mmetsp:Transcript_12055/g.19481  ORF Transcript_12055/g.19481 Transcript_12055/m.19481 type:complete len:99 (-) Transcript_12055:620-916(-)
MLYPHAKQGKQLLFSEGSLPVISRRSEFGAVQRSLEEELSEPLFWETRGVRDICLQTAETKASLGIIPTQRSAASSVHGLSGAWRMQELSRDDRYRSK